MEEAKFESKPSGYIIVDGMEVAHTKQCKHCGNHFISIKGSGVRRGWCTRCNGTTCGQKECDQCIPFEIKLDFTDGGNRGQKHKLTIQQKFPNIKRL